MKKLLLLLVIVLLFTLSGCKEKSKALDFGEVYDCMVYNYNEEERIDNVREWKIVDSILNDTKDGIYLETYKEEYFFSGSQWELNCVRYNIFARRD